jgi:hypothetical protein
VGISEGIRRAEPLDYNNAMRHRSNAAHPAARPAKDLERTVKKLAIISDLCDSAAALASCSSPLTSTPLLKGRYYAVGSSVHYLVFDPAFKANTSSLKSRYRLLADFFFRAILARARLYS